jgi:plasmid stabilization system protein ParE
VSYRVVLTPEAEAQLDSLYEYVAGETSIDVATRYVEAILARIAGLTDFPTAARRATTSGRASGPFLSAAASPSPTK